MPRYFLQLSYKGTNYSGFQVQENAPTVQAAVEQALQVLFRETFALTGSSRTDAGVHAFQNYFHFDTDKEITSRHVYNLNAILPQDISVKGIYAVPGTAHCRFDAVSREYKYYIHHQKDPFLTDRAWMYPFPLDMNKLREAAEIVTSYQDFTSFSKRNTQVNNFNCAIEYSYWNTEGGMLLYNVKANRFLRGMVRGLVGTMLKVGRGQLTAEGFVNVIESKDCRRADFSTPAHGLFLYRVNYNELLKGLLEG